MAKAKSNSGSKPNRPTTANKPGKKAVAAERRARVEAMQRAEQARERRNRIITVSVSTVIVAALIGFGAYAVDRADDKEEQNAAAAKKPVRGEKTWDAKKLGRNHVEKAVDYPMTPPVGGDHSQAWMTCEAKVYKKPIPNENAVHSLEHGAVWVTYNGKAPDAEVKKLADKVSRTSYSLMSPVEKQGSPIMLSAWGHQLTVDSAADPRVGEFFSKYVQGPQTPEPGAACAGGIDSA
ncbi:DUF3105 domain-containing protein [Streptomyces venezuelae]|uniref:DUF3105 domain-containing protein n=2 Tax=Streptomyces TaxID=1883 RepID=A0A5P2B4Z3_STRVZ|nr:DUF3105 domain-containing protein [Streptomyces sp. SID335]MYZ17871.1 DUF3105 domain-containing protein [Streptomyces sp. SID337]NDZ86133.1 DUF3105 domain-containing protein [Streptomyces sp. SID10115]NEA00975.1 DUF3105 domain-containing protein [Streptomyces sp. SID10116]NEB44934.1 DUF3105 domain-containing protein [Streptomyces sp. SID339]QES25553.1 hypothetical protein DEJ47_02960 [Streptomyces venezuelae]